MITSMHALRLNYRTGQRVYVVLYNLWLFVASTLGIC